MNIHAFNFLLPGNQSVSISVRTSINRKRNCESIYIFPFVFILGTRQFLLSMWKSNAMHRNWPIHWVWRFSKRTSSTICSISLPLTAKNSNNGNEKNSRTLQCSRASCGYYRSSSSTRETPLSWEWWWKRASSRRAHQYVYRAER